MVKNRLGGKMINSIEVFDLKDEKISVSNITNFIMFTLAVEDRESIYFKVINKRWLLASSELITDEMIEDLDK